MGRGADEGGEADRRTSGRGRAHWTDERIGADTAQTGGRADGGRQVDDWMGRTGYADARTGWRTSGRMDEGGWGRMDSPKDKTPQLTRQLTWPLEIQRGHPRVTVQTGHLL